MIREVLIVPKWWYIVEAVLLLLAIGLVDYVAYRTGYRHGWEDGYNEIVEAMKGDTEEIDADYFGLPYDESYSPEEGGDPHTGYSK